MENKIYNQLTKYYNLLKKPNNESLALSMDNVHHKGVFSLVIDGTEHGKLTRVFIANKKIKPFKVQFHTHRYSLKLTIIKGNIKHHLANANAFTAPETRLSLFNYKSPLNGGNGLEFKMDLDVNIAEYSLSVGSHIRLKHSQFHTMSCSKGSIWIVEELGFETDTSKVLGVPFELDRLYTTPKQFQINNSVQSVKKEIRKLMLHYELVESDTKPKAPIYKEGDL